jgi:hypothetical protein
MILVQNLRPRLNGNNKFILLTLLDVLAKIY